LVKYARTDVTASQVADLLYQKKLTIFKKYFKAHLMLEIKIEYITFDAYFSFDNYILMCRLIDGI
jgi:DNA polymerase-3 subunit beta